MKHLAKEHALQRRLGVRMATVRGELVASSGERYARVTRKPSAVKRPQQRSVRRGEEKLVTIRRGDGGPSVCAEKGGAREVDAIGAGRCGRRWCVVGCADMGANMTSITDAPSSIPSSHVAYTAPAAATSTAAAAVAAAAVAAAAAAAVAAAMRVPATLVQQMTWQLVQSRQGRLELGVEVAARGRQAPVVTSLRAPRD